MTAIKPFSINIPQAQLDDLQNRLANTRWPDELPGVEWSYGIPLSYAQDLVKRWQGGYDWRAWEARINQYPQFTTEIDGQNIHFLHVRSPEPNAFPLIMLHGWPMTIVEYLDLIEPLTNPRAHGGDPKDAFHVIIPSIPGFGFSGSTKDTGWNSGRIGKVFAELMKRLGYERYGVQGNDVGSTLAPELGRADVDHVAGVHVTQIFSFPSGDPAEFEGLTEQDYYRLHFAESFMKEKGAYNQLQSTQPQTIAYALLDSPVGQLAWSCQLLGEVANQDYILTNVSIYWFTKTAGSSARFYYEENHYADHPTERTTTPTAVAVFPKDFLSIRRFAERDHNITRWTEFKEGGHNSSQDAPELLIGDLREFFSALR